jgi:cell division septum initiation protein DivIVA
MYRRTAVDTLGGAVVRQVADEEPGAADPGALPALRRPEPGGLAQLFDRRPMFRRRHRGYDRFQVDEYVAWAEAELDAARRQCDYLLSRYGACTAQLEIARQAPRTPRPSVTGRVSARLGEMLRVASEEAEAIAAAGIDEAERIVTDARLEAGARLAKVTAIREAALAAGEELRARARRDAEELIRTAEAQRAAAATDAAAELAAVRAEVDDLRRQRDESRQALQRLTAQIGQALQVVATGDPNALAALAERHPVAS